MPDLYDNVNLEDATVIHRTEKCDDVFATLAITPVRLLRSPPGSGKTSFANLLQERGHALGRTVRVVTMTGATAGRLDEAEFLERDLGEPVETALNPRSGSPRTIIIDEAQCLYALGAAHPFWVALKDISVAGSASQVQVLLMGVYGLWEGRPLSTPLDLPAWSLAFLELDAAEVSAFFGAFNSTCREHNRPPVPLSLQAAMVRLCGRHVGLLRAALRYFSRSFVNRATVTEEDVFDCVSYMLQKFGSGQELRSLPQWHKRQLTEEEHAFMFKVAAAGEEGLVLSAGDAMVVPKGLLLAGIIDAESMPGLAALQVRFSSPIMRIHTLRHLFDKRHEQLLSDDEMASAALFARAVIKRMRRSDLARSWSVAAGGSLLERSYQMAFYA